MKRLSVYQQLAWVYLLSLGSSNNGKIDFLTEDSLATMMGLQPTDDEWEMVSGSFKRFEELNMITHDNETIVIINYEKRQQSNLTGYERVKRYRERNKPKNRLNVINDNVNDNGSDNDRLDKNRLDKIRIEEEVAPAKIINSLNLTKGQVMVLLKTFPGMSSEEIKAEARKCSDYMAMSSGDYKNPGLFFRGWMNKTYPEWKKKRAEEERNAKLSQVLPDLTPEQIERNRQRIAEIKSKFPVKTI